MVQQREAHLQNQRRLLERQRTAMPSWEMHLLPATGGLLGARAVQRRNSPRSKGQCPQPDASAAWRVHTTFVSRLRPMGGTHVFFSGRTAIPSYQERSSVSMGARRGSSFSSAEGALICSRCARSFWSIPSIRSRLRCISGRDWRYPVSPLFWRKWTTNRQHFQDAHSRSAQLHFSDTEPGDTPRLSEREENPSVSEQLSSDTSPATTRQPPTSQNVSPEYGPSHPRRSKRPREPQSFLLLKLRFLYFTWGVLELCFLELSLCPFGANAAALIVSAGKWFIPRRAFDLFCALCTLWSVAKYCGLCLVTHSIRYALCSSTLLYSSRKRNCLPSLSLCSPNKVQCILYKVLWVLKLCQGKTQQITLSLEYWTEWEYTGPVL